MNENLLASAGVILAEASGNQVHLTSPQTLRAGPRSLLLHCALADASFSTPASVVIKSVVGDYHPDAPPEWFLAEWAGWEFLSRVFPDRSLSGRFWGGSRSAGFIVVEDLGDGPSLADLLQAKDRDQAETGLRSYAAALGQLHARTIGRARELEAMRSAPGYCHVPFPTCRCVSRIPFALLPELESAYRAELKRGCPAAADDARFYPALMSACASWTVSYVRT